MDEVTLKHGRRNITLRKNDDLIAIRPSSQASVTEVLAHAPADASAVGTKLDQFQIVKVNDTPARMEKTLDTLRKNYLVDAGSHVYHTPNSTAPIVPTGKITVRFTPSSTKEEREQVLMKHSLEVVESEVDEVNGSKVTTYTLRTTPDSPNPLKVVNELQRSNDVVSLAEADLATPGALAVFQMPGDTLLKEQWHLRNTGIQFGDSTGLRPGADARVVAAWQRAQSLGSPSCIVAVIDDGFDLTHPDLAGNSKVVAPWDFTTSTNNPAPRRFSTDPRQGDYHGTACAGVAIGNANGVGITGAAPACRFMPIRWTSTISNDTIKNQFEYVAAQGAWVVSCSWGAAADYFPLSTVMEKAIAKCAREGRNGLGCVIVFAAGNDDHNINDPNGETLNGFAVHPDVIAVAACNSLDEKSNYSNFGREISICAPSSGAGGVRILTSDVRGTFQSDNNQVFAAGYDAGDYTRTFGGTSSATPLVAGICALLLSVNPSLTSREVKQILESTTRRIGSNDSYDERGHSIFFGSGCVNADAAVKKAMESVAPAGLRSRPGRNNNNGQPGVRDLTLYGSEYWGISRHELIASVATGFLTPRAKSEIGKLLNPLNQTLAQAAAWADLIKGKKPSPGMDRDTQQFLKDYPNDASKPWHYVNLPLGIGSYDEADRLGFTRDDDVVHTIERCVQVLQGRERLVSRLNALRWLVHLVGDVHQPLHVGCGFINSTGGLERDPKIIKQTGLESDKGGNSLVLPVSGSITLHSYWDSYLPSDQESLQPSDLSSATTSPAVRSAEIAVNNLWGRLKRDRIVTGQPSTVATLNNVADPCKWAIGWANSSLSEARKAYRFLQIKRKLSSGKYEVAWPGKAVYDAECRPIVSKQIAAAANNLAELLNAIFAS